MMKMNTYEIRLIGIFRITGCQDCEQGRKLGTVDAADVLGAKQAAIEKWPDVRESEVYPFLVSPCMCSVESVGSMEREPFLAKGSQPHRLA